ERIVGVAVLKNELALIVAPDDELAGARSVKPERLAGRVWLMREQGSGTRQLVAEFLADHGLRPQTLTLGSNGAIKEAVRLGLGGPLRARGAADHGLRERARGEVAVRGGLPQRQWYALHSATVPPRPAVEQFLEFANGPAGRRAFEKRGAS